MNLLQSMRIALEMLRLHKLRAFLTMLGVIIGVMSVSIIVMISNGFQSYLDSQFKKLGADTIIMIYDPGRQGRGRTLGSLDGLSMTDVSFIRDRVTSVDVISAVQQIPSQKAKYEDKEYSNATVTATDEFFTVLNRIGVQEGRQLNAADVATKANVCVIGEDIRDTLFPDKKAIGKYILLPGITLEVVGVSEKTDIGADSTARAIYLPLSTAQQKWIGGRTVSYITLRPKAGLKVNDTVDAVWQAMMVRSGNRPVYRIDSREAIAGVFGGVVGAAGVILAAIAALSLLVGGIGIMNIMLVSVTERTKEIGLRKAVGARSGAILGQFLTEAATLSLVGGLIGMGIAFMIGNMVYLITVAKEWPSKGGLATPFPIGPAIVAAAFSALIGMVFGLYPAVSAAKLDPIVALRKE